MQEKLQKFAEILERERIESLKRRDLGCQANVNNCAVHIRPGKKYVKVDVGGSGAYMVDQEGNIFGIKGYGVIHRGHQYGTLDTLAEWHWGEYTAIKKQA